MCSMCNSYPCNPVCPNADEPLPIGKCNHCKEGIYVGDEIVEVGGKTYHCDCLYELPQKEMFKLLGFEVKEAGE